MKPMASKRRIEIQETIYIVEKCLGLNGVDVYQYIDACLEKKYRTVGRYMQVDDLIHFREHFLGLVDIAKANPLDIARFHRNMDNLENNGTKQLFRADVENAKRRHDPYVKTGTIQKL